MQIHITPEQARLHATGGMLAIAAAKKVDVTPELAKIIQGIVIRKVSSMLGTKQKPNANAEMVAAFNSGKKAECAAAWAVFSKLMVTAIKQSWEFGKKKKAGLAEASAQPDLYELNQSCLNEPCDVPFSYSVAAVNSWMQMSISVQNAIKKTALAAGAGKDFIAAVASENWSALAGLFDRAGKIWHEEVAAVKGNVASGKTPNGNDHKQRGKSSESSTTKAKPKGKAAPRGVSSDPHNFDGHVASRGGVSRFAGAAAANGTNRVRRVSRNVVAFTPSSSVGIKSEIQMHEDVYMGVFDTDLAKVEKFLTLLRKSPMLKLPEAKIRRIMVDGKYSALYATFLDPFLRAPNSFRLDEAVFSPFDHDGDIMKKPQFEAFAKLLDQTPEEVVEEMGVKNATDAAKVAANMFQLGYRLIDIDEALGNGDADFWASMMEDARVSP